MARGKFERKKPHVNIGTIWHVDHGKVRQQRGQRRERYSWGASGAGPDGGTTTLLQAASQVEVRRSAMLGTEWTVLS